MKLRSDSFNNGAPIPERFCAGRLEGLSGVAFGDNLNPHLAWEPGPAGTRSYALICHDPDVPSQADDVNKADREVPSTLARVDFFHWILIDLPLGVTEIVEGEFTQGFTARGKAGPATLHGARHGLNDYTGWFANDADMAGQYHGYDGPFPPFNDSILHRYVFTLYALNVAKLNALDGSFTGAQVRQAMQPHVLSSSTWAGTYTLNRRLRVA